MNTNSGNSNAHERARMLTAIAPQGRTDPEELSSAEQSWLAAHLEACASCREFSESADHTVRSLRTISISAGTSLVSATRARIRLRAQELHLRQDRLRIIWVCCAAVTICTAFNTVLLWRGFAWMGEQLRISAPIGEVTFLVFGLMPAIVTGILLIARGTHLADHDGPFQG